MNAKNDKAAISSKLEEYRDRFKLNLPVNYRPYRLFEKISNETLVYIEQKTIETLT